jgi:hypothetical protein
MTKEIILEDGNLAFIFVGIEPYDYLHKAINIFESNFKFIEKKHISGWHSTIFQYSIEDLVITIGDAYDTLSLTLISPYDDNAIEKVRAWVNHIDESLNYKATNRDL